MAWEEWMRVVVALFLAVVCGVFCVMSSVSADKSVTVGDDRLQVTLICGSGGLKESHFKVSGKFSPDLSGSAWAIDIDGSAVSSLSSSAQITVEDKTFPAKHASVTGELPEAKWQMDYQLTGPGRITKTLTLTPRKDLTLQRVAMWNVLSDAAPVVSRTSLQDIAAFYRFDGCGLFASLDFPYSKITTEKGVASVDYPPFDTLKAGQSYTCHSLTFGITQLTGRLRYGFDEGEVEAVDSYVQERYQPRFSRPMFTTACIVNRYTQVQGGVIFYTMKDHPTLTFNTDLLKREIAMMPKLGIEYYQLFPGVFDWAPDDPQPETVRDITAFAHKNGVRVGDYSGCSSVFCPHYNEYGNSFENHPEWGLKGSDMCFGNPKFVDFYRDTVAANAKKYGFEFHCLDFLNIQPCNNPDHGHPLGRDSIYAQVRGIVNVLNGINDVAPEMMTWSNSGNWSEFLPKIAWSNPNLYLTDPFIASPWQGLNMTRLLDDARREQMVSLHYSRFIPYRFLTNCQYFFSQNSIVPDIRNYQYGALSTVAVTPNLCLAEIRPWIDSLPADEQQQVFNFYGKWTKFLKKNYDLWTKTYHVGENPGMGSVEVYSHAQGNHGFIFLINPQYWDRTVEVPLDGSLGFSGEGQCEIAELYPTERLHLTDQGPFAKLGSKVPVHVPAQRVLVLEVRSAPVKIEQPRIYGIPGSIELTKGGYLIKTHGMQGTTERCAVLFPQKSPVITSAEVRDYPKQPKRSWSPTPVKLLSSDGNSTLMEITFRRDKAPTELREWTVKPGSLADGAANWPNALPDGEKLQFPLLVDTNDSAIELPMWDANADKLGLGPLSDFCGAYIDNAFQEDQETLIDLRTGGKADVPKATPLGIEAPAELRPLSPLAKDAHTGWWLQTSFHLPFMNSYGCEPAFDDHTILVLPFVRQSRIAHINAWMNGAPLDVRAYRYPRNRGIACYYADLIGTGAHGGENKLVVWFEASK